MIKNFWDQRYSEDGFAYGTEPNVFFSEMLGTTEPGTLLLPGEGEGRNAIHAARRGWSVTALDQSRVALEKAMKWARQENLNLDYQLGQVEDFNPHGNLFDLVAIVYVHLIPEIRAKMFHLLAACVKPGGKLILECFHKNQLDFRTGGPVLEDMLYSEEELLSDFITLDIELCKEFKVDIFEGRYHKGTSSVIRIVACMG